MAPILSKAALPPPKNNQERLERAIKKASIQAQPLVKSMFDILKSVTSTSSKVKNEAESILDSVRVKLDQVCLGCVRILESLCCLDVNRFAKPEKPLTGSLPILFVLMIVIMLYNAFVFGYMPAAGISINARDSLLFHAWIFLLLASFAQAVRTDPGSTPVGPRWRDKENPPPEATERKCCSTEARWCRKSNAYKPDRAHYCRVLQKGVLRMDHYCPWLGNTVGFYNQKFFFLFLLYTNAACAQMGISFLQLLVQYTLPAMTTFCLFSAEGLTLLISSLLVPFFLFHVWLMARNTTTIEFCERLREKREDGAAEGTAPLNYDMGIWANFKAVLGSDPLLWFLPVGGPPGDGITFPVSSDAPQASGRATSAASGTSDEEKHNPLLSDNDASPDPEATHPVACGEIAAKTKRVPIEGKDVEMGNGNGKVDAEESVRKEGDEEEEEEQDEADEEVEGSYASGSGSVHSDAGNEGFLVWRDSAEFVEDLTIGCQFIAEKAEDCGHGTLLCLLTSCVPSAWARKARGLTSIARPKRSLPSTRVFPKKNRSSIPAVKIVPVRSGDGSNGGEGEDDSGTSASSE